MSRSSRRLFRQLTVGLSAAVLVTSIAGGTARGEVEELVMREAGGKSGASIQKGYIEPFTKKTGIRVIRKSPWKFGMLRAMVESGSVTATLFELDSMSLEQAKALDLIEPLDWDAINPEPVFKEARQEKAFGYQYYSTIMAWRSDAKAPSDWEDFWNVEAFPGKRALADYPVFTLPFAVLAAGVEPENLYPLDLDLAFEMLEKIKDHVAVWYQSGAQAPQLLKDGEVSYAIAWSGRVAGLPGIETSFKDGMLDLSYFTVPKGADPEKKIAAMKLLHEMTVPSNQLAAAKVVSYTGNSPALNDLLPQDRLDEYPTTEKNKSVQFLAQPEWWYDHAEEIEERWQQFKLGL